MGLLSINEIDELILSYFIYSSFLGQNIDFAYDYLQSCSWFRYSCLWQCISSANFVTTDPSEVHILVFLECTDDIGFMPCFSHRLISRELPPVLLIIEVLDLFLFYLFLGGAWKCLVFRNNYQTLECLIWSWDFKH